MRPVIRPVLFVLLLLTAGCSGDDAAPAAPATPTETAPATPTAPDPSPSTSPPSPRPTSAPTTEEPPPAALPLDEVTASWQVVGDGFEGPLQVLEDPRDGRVLVVEQVGRVSTLDGDVALDLTDRVSSGGERGLLGVAFHPDGDRLFVHYSGDDGQTVLSSFPADGVLDPAQETVLLEVDQPAGNHNGGALLFDRDGALILALGDGGGAGDQFGNGQDPGTLLGTLLRLDVDADPEGVAPFRGNPFVDGGGDPLVWTYGLRNPWRIAYDADRLYVTDVGQDAVEEVSVVDRGAIAGANFGWPILEGSVCFQQADCDPSGTVPPVVELRHEDGACSIIGGVVVPDGHPTGLGGAFLFSDLCDTSLRALRVDGDAVETRVVEGAVVPSSPLGFGTGSTGQVWVGTADGEVLELVPG